MQPQDGALLFQVRADQSQIQKMSRLSKNTLKNSPKKSKKKAKSKPMYGKPSSKVQPPISPYKARNPSLAKW